MHVLGLLGIAIQVHKSLQGAGGAPNGVSLRGIQKEVQALVKNSLLRKVFGLSGRMRVGTWMEWAIR